jgi:hypothetical protein
MTARIATTIRAAALVALAVGALLGPTRATAGTAFGVRTGVYTDAQSGFLGAEALTSVAPAWYFNPNMEYAFAGDRDVLTLNGDFQYDILRERPYDVWAGAGPAFVRRERDTGDHRNALGVNLIGGIGWKISARFVPYAQAKVTVSDQTEAVLSFGVRF